ncbi:MAG: mercury resistance system transport protein MerF [Pseudomonadota bacterium]
MAPKTLFRIGIAGSFVTALCCFSPLLLIIASAIGLTVTGLLVDFILLPAFIGFLGLTAYAYWRLKRSAK